MRSVLCAVVGGVAALRLPALPGDVGLLALAVCAVGLGVAERTRPVGVGLLVAVWVLVAVDQRLTTRLSHDGAVDVVCEAHVVGLPVQGVGRLGLVVDLRDCVGSAEPLPPVLRARVTWYRPVHTLLPGQRWRMPLRLRAPRGHRNFHGFDYETWLFQRGLDATGTLRANAALVQLGDQPVNVDRFRWRLRERLRSLTANLAHGGLVEALAFGSRDRIDANQQQLLSRSGTAHLVAISGLHIGMVASVGFALAAAVWRIAARAGTAPPVSSTLFAGCVGLLLAGGYAALAGFALPTVRALVMLAAAFTVTLSRRRLDGAACLGLAFFAVLLVRPLSLVDAGFWLSFLAVGVILTGLRARRHWPSWQGALWVNGAVGLLLTPVTVWVFGEVHWVSPVANVLLVPLFGLIVVPGVLFAVAVMPVSPTLASVTLGAVDWILSTCLHVLSSLLDALPSGLPTPVSAAALCALGCAAALALLPRSWPLSFCALAAAVLMAFTLPPARPPVGHLRVTVLDVGHGLALVLETATRTLVYDTGPRRGRFDAGAQVVTPAVRAGGHARVDQLVVSHADSDHAGGVVGLLARMPVARVLRPEDGSCRAGVHWTWDKVRFDVLHPGVADRGHENDRSCVLRATTAGGQSLLLLGDVERRGERALLQRGLDSATVMTVPHHGSTTSSSDALLDTVAPALAINSAARAGRFRLPHPRVVARYRARGIPLIGTAQHGAVRFTLPFTDPAAPRWESARADRRWLWHRRLNPARCHGAAC